MPEPPPPVAGIRLRNAGKILYFHTAGMRLEVGEYVVVETVRGAEIGRVVIAPGQVLLHELNLEELKPILRLATEADIQRMDALRQRAESLLPEARKLADDAGFPAHVDAAEFTLDGRRLSFTFASEERLDYRDFLRRAGERFGVKVDMRQVGSRDRAKLAGGYGICGRELCCANWLTAFPSISIRMAKEQDLPLNPQKISGLCGRLLCCLSYEEEGYREMRKTLPKLGQRCSTPTGEGKVIGINILRRQVTLLVDGQRVDVGDRDLGTVVRWDTASKAGDPPPSISRADAIAQGLIEADEADLRGDADEGWLAERPEPGGRGRLPGGGPRKEIRSRPAPQKEPAAEPGSPEPPPARRGRGERPAREPQPQPQQREPRRPRGERPQPPPRPEATPEQEQRASRRRGRGGGEGQPGGQGPRPPGVPGAQTRVFRRGGDAAPGDASPGNAGTGNAGVEPDAAGNGEAHVRRSARRRGRGGRPQGGPGEQPQSGGESSGEA